MDSILTDLKTQVSELVDLEDLGGDKYRVITPFVFGDGDHLTIVLRRLGQRWAFVDEGMTLLRLSYRIDSDDLKRGNRERIITDTLSRFGVTQESGELSKLVDDDEFGSALSEYVQGLLRVTDVEFLSREHVISTFTEDLAAAVYKVVPKGLVVPGWYDRTHDPDGKSPVDYVIQRARPIAIFGLQNDNRVRDATITLLQLEKWGVRVHSIGVFEDFEAIPAGPVGRLADVVDKMFTAVTGEAGQRFQTYLGEEIAGLS